MKVKGLGGLPSTFEPIITCKRLRNTSFIIAICHQFVPKIGIRQSLHPKFDNLPYGD